MKFKWVQKLMRVLLNEGDEKRFGKHWNVLILFTMLKTAILFVEMQ